MLMTVQSECGRFVCSMRLLQLNNNNHDDTVTGANKLDFDWLLARLRNRLLLLLFVFIKFLSLTANLNQTTGTQCTLTPFCRSNQLQSLVISQWRTTATTTTTGWNLSFVWVRYGR